MIRCASCRPLLSKYVDGEILPTEREQVERHIVGCADCTRRLIEYRQFRPSLTELPNYRAPARLRARLMASLDATDTRTDEVQITRRLAPDLRIPATTPQRMRLFGNLASGFALVLVMAGVALLWQIAGPGPIPANASPTITSNSSTPIIQVPTTIARITSGSTKPQPTGVAAIGPGTGNRPTATSESLTAAGETVHSVRDETYGYTLQYPAGWWTAESLPLVGTLSHRLLRSWDVQSGEAGNMTVDVLARKAGVPDTDAVRGWCEPGAQITALAGAVDGLAGFSSSSEAHGRRTHSVYLFDRSLVYRLTVESALPAFAPPGQQAAPGDGPNSAFDAVLNGFRSAPDAASNELGFAPTLFVHAGDLWQAGREGAAPQQITHGGLVRDFALSPDLDHVALLLASSPSVPGASSLEVRSLAGDSVSRYWQTSEIRSFAWYGDRELLAIGGAPLGIYQLALAPGEPKLLGAPALLFDLSKLPGGAADAHDLRVSPDRRWVSFFAGADLYGLRPDSGFWRSLLPKTVPRPTAYAWMPPTDLEPAPRLMMLTPGQLSTLAIPADAAAPILQQMAAVNSTADDLAVAANGAVAVMDRKSGLLVGETTPGVVYRVMALPSGSPVAGSLAWCANGRYLIYRQADSPTAHLMMLDVTGTHPRTLTDTPISPR
ncbi:MAG: anti-sigma factor family protein [Chloroflexia bacterium]